MAESNYEFMKNQMQLKFLTYDQNEMIEKFALEHDEQYLYIRFLSLEYRIDRKSGKVQWSEDGFHNQSDADYNAAMTLFDVLCCSKKDCHLSGKFHTIHNLKGTVYSSNPGNDIFRSVERYFDHKTELLHAACRQLGGTKESIGDVSYRLWVFDFLPVIFQFWESDDEFKANLQLLWDENILDYMHYETTYFASAHLFERLQRLMEKERVSK